MLIVGPKEEISCVERYFRVIAELELGIVESHVVSVVVTRIAPLVGVLREENFVKITKLEMAELQGLSFGLKMEYVALERISLKTEAKKAETAGEIIRWETAALQWGSVAERR